MSHVKTLFLISNLEFLKCVLNSEKCQIAALKTNVSEFFSARNISMAEEKLLLLVITYARPRLFFSTLKVHDPMVTNCYYTFFSTYNLVTTSVYFASTCSLSKTCFASLKFSWLFANFLLMKNRSKFHYICPAWICRFFMDSLRGPRGESSSSICMYVKKPQFKTHIIGWLLWK